MKQETIGSPAISVIVPIYNMEKLMRKCLDSILAQTFQDYECLLIDDGSKDGSPAICDEYAAKDPRFKAFHKPNGGLSDARNYGIERAQGEYTIFFDPDDWVDADCLTEMYAKAVETDADMVMCDLYNNDLYRQIYCKQEPTSLDHDDVLMDLITGKIGGFTVTKLIRRMLYLRYNLQYPIGVYGCEDQYTMCKLLKNNIKITYLPKAFYHYMHYGSNSQSRRYDENTYELDRKIVGLFVNLYANTPYQELARVRKTSYMVGHAFLDGYRFFTNKKFIEEFGQYEQLLKLVPRMRTTNVMYWLSFRGFFRQARKIYGFILNTNEKIKCLKNGRI